MVSSWIAVNKIILLVGDLCYNVGCNYWYLRKFFSLKYQAVRQTSEKVMESASEKQTLKQTPIKNAAGILFLLKQHIGIFTDFAAYL